MKQRIAGITREIASLPYVGRAFLKVFRPIRKKLKCEESVMCTFGGGVKIRVDLSNHLESRIFWQGMLEGDAGEMKLLDRILKRESTKSFIDIGAHVGIFTLYAANRIPKGQVHSFEPLNHHFEKLENNVNINKYDNVQLNNVLLMGTSRTEELVTPSGDDTQNPHMQGSGSSSVYGFENEKGTTKHQVKSTTLDQYVDTNSIERVDVIKIDVEGAELDVLQGALHTIDRYRPLVLMELDSGILERAGRTVKDVLRFWRDHGYSVQRIEFDGSLTKVTDPSDLSTKQNILAEPART